MTEISRRNLLKLAGATAALAPLLGTAVLAKPSIFGPDEKVYYLSELRKKFKSDPLAFRSHVRNITTRDWYEGKRSVLIGDETYSGIDGQRVLPGGLTVMYCFHKVIMIEPDTKRWKVIKDRMKEAPYYV
jgi:hypothetical protein